MIKEAESEYSELEIELSGSSSSGEDVSPSECSSESGSSDSEDSDSEEDVKPAKKPAAAARPPPAAPESGPLSSGNASKPAPAAPRRPLVQNIVKKPPSVAPAAAKKVPAAAAAAPAAKPAPPAAARPKPPPPQKNVESGDEEEESQSSEEDDSDSDDDLKEEEEASPAAAGVAAVEEEEDDDAPSRALRREENIKAMLAGDLEIHRKSMLPKILKVEDAAAVILRKPFKSPHPNAPARSQSLKRALVARKQFVPWGSGKPFQPVKMLLTAPEDEDDPSGAAPDAVELPPGVEPLVLWEPQGEGAEAGSSVRVDDALTRFLRPHQREGVQFMFECVSGLRNFDGHGCILADDMGLGKTLQGIALLWTLLNNGHEQLGGAPMAKRVIICCPTSLVSNWDSECSKWLNGRVRTLPLCESSREDVISTINQFLSPRFPAQLLIVSYETFRLHAERFQAPGSCDLLICDEAHRLKNDQTLTNRALDSLSCRRRVLLSGTPMQNQLQEFFSMVNFCNPGVLGTPAQFRRHFEAPILAGREPDASDAESTLGAERSSELSEIVNEFILRRTNSLLSAHLPPKVVEVVCCRMTPLQFDLYQHFVGSRSVRNLFGNAGHKSARVLSAITSLRKLLNHPKLIYDMEHSTTSKSTKAEGGAEGFENCADLFPEGIFSNARGGMPPGWELMSGKFAVVARMLALMREQTKDRVVIVSNFTQTLDLFTTLCRERGYPCLRLDGSTSINKRQKLVKTFNDLADNQFVFLLSSKAGGCGLNLIGGNRLILFDMSWNPADDKQAAARVWRDGQRRRVYVYRFMTTGTIEEKVYQRQLSKEGLQAVVESSKSGGGGGSAVMSLDELRDLFSYNPDTLSTTYDHMVADKGHHKKKADKPAKKAGKSGGGKKAKKQAVVGDSDSDEEFEVMEIEEGGEEAKAIDLTASDEEAEDADGAGGATGGMGMRSKALWEANGGRILKEQEGTPKEEDLAAWAHHSDPTTVPDELMKFTGGEDVSFVFSCQVEGRDVPPDPPLAPFGQRKAADGGRAGGNHLAGGHLARRAIGAPQRPSPLGPAAITPQGGVLRVMMPPASRGPPSARAGNAAVGGTKENSRKNTPVTAAVSAPPMKKVTPKVTHKAASASAGARSAAAAMAVPPTQPQALPREAPAAAVSLPQKKKVTPPSASGKKAASGACSAPAAAVPRPAAPAGPKSQPAAKRKSPSGETAAAPAPGAPPSKRTAVVYDSDDDFV